MRAALRPADGGFTLLEVMAALVVFLAGVVGVLGLFGAGLALHREATIRQETASAASDAREAAYRHVLDHLAEGGDLDEVPAVEGQPLPGRERLFFDAQYVPDPEAGAAGGVLARIHVYTRDVGRKKGLHFLAFLRPFDPWRGIPPAGSEGRTTPPGDER